MNIKLVRNNIIKYKFFVHGTNALFTKKEFWSAKR